MKESFGVQTKGNKRADLPKEVPELSNGRNTYEDMQRAVECRKEYLVNVIRKCDTNLETAPKGALRLSNTRGKTTYYWRKEENDKHGSYIPEYNRGLAQRLAQKAVDGQSRRASQMELEYLWKFTEKYPKRVESVYDELSEARKKLVLPLVESDEDFAGNWQSQEFVPHPTPPADDSLVTDRGEVVRSRAEVILVNMMFRMGIPYYYEKPLYLEGEGTIRPDLTALCVRERREKYIEYFGMMSIPEYAAKAVRRINSYARNGIHLGDRLIAIFEAEGAPLDTRLVRDLLLRHFL